jgi:hypothetical protein
VVVSTPVNESGAVYVYCSKVEKIRYSSSYSYATRIWAPKEKFLFNAVNKLKRQAEISPPSERPWDKHLEAGKDILKGQESNFHRPMIKKDRLFYTKPDGSVIQVEHPRPTGFAARNFNEGWTNIRYGAIGCGYRIARSDPLRIDFAKMNGIKAYQQEHDAVLESIESNSCESYLVILGMCDYEDGTKQEWRSYAALAAAAYMKSLVLQL